MCTVSTYIVTFYPYMVLRHSGLLVDKSANLNNMYGKDEQMYSLIQTVRAMVWHYSGN